MLQFTLAHTVRTVCAIHLFKKKSCTQFVILIGYSFPVHTQLFLYKVLLCSDSLLLLLLFALSSLPDYIININFTSVP